ncbi:hypothetical protein F5888DRAFT_633121 [Russula emetica]|nr:hypothetical protein F5888DRAFT_633121 [Russula emetica]
MRFGSLLSLSGLSRQFCLMSIGLGKSIYSTLRTVTFIWNSFGRGSDQITLYISFRNRGVFQVTCGNIEHMSCICSPVLTKPNVTKLNGCGIINVPVGD